MGWDSVLSVRASQGWTPPPAQGALGPMGETLLLTDQCDTVWHNCDGIYPEGCLDRVKERGILGGVEGGRVDMGGGESLGTILEWKRRLPRGHVFQISLGPAGLGAM